MNTICTNSRGLIPSYLDGEVSEEQAGPLRRHLLDCPACREFAKSDSALKRWFVVTPAARAPAGFAARVARRAFAGDAGDAPEGGPSLRGLRSPLGSLVAFVQLATAAAALVVIAFSVAIRSHELPRSHELEAEEDLSEIFRQLDRENRAAELRLGEPSVDVAADVAADVAGSGAPGVAEAAPDEPPALERR